MQRYIIYGAGAVGGTIGALLQRHGHEVVLIARGAHLEAIRSDGLHLTTHAETWTERLTAVGHPSEIEFGADDVILLCMKSQDTEAALHELLRASAVELPIVCAQNGVANERVASRLYANVYGMLVWLPSSYLEPGRVLAYGKPTIGLLDAGRYPSGVDSCIEEVTAALSSSGLTAVARDKIMPWKYQKLLLNLTNAFGAVLGLDANWEELGRAARAEARDCYKAAGIECISDEESTARRADIGVHGTPIPGTRTPAGSSWQSLERGQGSIETDYLNGEIVLLGRLHGVATPVNFAIQRLANRMAWHKRKPGELSLEDFEAEHTRIRESSP